MPLPPLARQRIATALILILGAFTLSATTSARAAESAPAKPLSVLFLGDAGHHQPAARAAQLIPVMATRGINITYSEATTDLNPTTLAKYDVLLIYANTERIEPEQEQALLDFVERGGGFAPLHCASYCFLNSPKYVALVGAQFKSHGTGEFDVKDIDPTDPILQGAKPFRTWDETYVHTKHNDVDRHLLQVRDENGRAEPWTWTRTQGQGRVFYTAYGHDNRTWGNPGFVDLDRAWRFAGPRTRGRSSIATREVSSTAPPLTYRARPRARSRRMCPARTGGRWARRSRRMQLPASPSDSMKHLALPRGLEPRLYRRRTRHRQADRAGLGPQGAALHRRDVRLSQQHAAQRQGARPDQDLRGHRRRRASPTSSPSSPIS